MAADRQQRLDRERRRRQAAAAKPRPTPTPRAAAPEPKARGPRVGALRTIRASTSGPNRRVRAELFRPGNGTVQVALHIPHSGDQTLNCLWPPMPIDKLPGLLDHLRSLDAMILEMTPAMDDEHSECCPRCAQCPDEETGLVVHPSACPMSAA